VDQESTHDEAVTDLPVSTPPAAGASSAEFREAEPRPPQPRSANQSRAGEPRRAEQPLPEQRSGGGGDFREASERNIGQGREASERNIGQGRIGEPRPAVAEPTVPTNIYRARRPAVAVFLVIPAVAVGLLLVRALTVATFGQTFLIDGVIASSLGLASLPLLVAGLYGLITGAAHGAEQWGFRVWAKPPLAYLVVGIAFAIAAGIAVG
jgi:hypothetical protein